MLAFLLPLFPSLRMQRPPRFNPADEEEDTYAIINSENLGSRKRGRTLARYYLDNFGSFRNSNEQYQALLYCLTELALIIDKSATRSELQYGIGNHLHKILEGIDQRDRQLKSHFKDFQAEGNSLKEEIDNLVNQTRAELEEMVKSVRKGVMRELKTMIRASIDEQADTANQVSQAAGAKIHSIESTSNTQMILFFAGFQILIGLCLYFSWKYAALKS
jgi:DNA anti-recombination protein RmuC